MTINDLKERNTALDITQSFIVQAPAGSGKTELLTQRFLKLLAHVEKHPEEILAITFTRKAAREMQQRILQTLQEAKEQPEPTDDFKKQKWQLAQAVLKRNQEAQWNLLANPNRLRIQTIDSFCASLTQQMPVLSRFGAQPTLTDKPQPLYDLAIESLLASATDNKTLSNALETILLHLDNRTATLHQLLTNMLAKRDQWLPDITRTRHETDLRKKLERNLTAINQDAIDDVYHALPDEEKETIKHLAQFAALWCDRTSAIKQCENSNPKTLDEQKNYWLGIAELFLTKENDRRKIVTIKQGFPAKSSLKDKSDKEHCEAMKNKMKSLCTSMHDDFISALIRLRTTPAKNYSDAQWEVLSALFIILPLAVAHLTLQFKEHNQIDFTEMTQAALLALGAFDSPTDLALSLDYQINHILVDEFQDTSITQLRLLECLTAGWHTNDNRTLFLVGDPMQSIYRFRQAEVGLFLRAQNEGIGNIPLASLTLSTNFRSTHNVVSWINEACQQFFPKENRITEGAVTYSPAIASNNIKNADAVTIQLIENADDEAKKMLTIIQSARSETPTHSIAILVKARSHLHDIIPLLQQEKIPYQAIDIEPLEKKPFVQDLFSLTKALLHLADRTAWFSILRAPWCGLSLADLLQLAKNSDSNTIFENLLDNACFAQLSADGQLRATAFLNVIKPAIATRARMPLRDWVEATWLQLQANHYLKHESELKDVETFLSLLAQYDSGGDILNFSDFEAALDRLYASPNDPADYPIQLMTIHKAKGLEFDTVIIPSCHRTTPHDDPELLLFADQPRAHHDIALIFAPIKAAHEIEDATYRYLKSENAEKSQYEDYRLLYVALTRAKNQLYLLGKQDADSESFFYYLSSFVPDTKENERATQEKKIQTISPHFYRIPVKHLNTNPKSFTEQAGDHYEFNPLLQKSLEQTSLGTLAHEILQQIVLTGTDVWQATPIDDRLLGWSKRLLQLGITDESHIKSLIAILKTAIEKTLSDTKGSWILSSHTESAAELPLIDPEGNQLIIDRTFIDENETRWIIDYKTTLDTIDDIDAFLADAKTQHQPQLSRYAAAFRTIDNRPIKTGIYYPLQQWWIE